MNNAKLNGGFLWTTYMIILLLASLYSLHAYWFWHVDRKVFNILFAILSLLPMLNSSWIAISKHTIISVLLLFFANYYIQPSGNINILLNCIVTLLPIFSIFILSDIQKQDLFYFFETSISIVLTVSLISWLLFLMGVQFNSVFDFFGHTDDGYEYVFNNFFLFVQNIGNKVSDTFRFSGIFLEPGYLGILCVFLLYIEQFNFKKWQCKVLLATIVCTLSLASYLMTIAAYLATIYFSGNNKQFQRILLFSVAVTVASVFITYYNDGDNIVSDYILKRLEWNSETNNIVGYNRTNEALDDQFVEIFENGNWLFGIGELNQWAGGVGFKVYIIKYGVIGLFLFFLSIFYLYSINKSKQTFILFLIFVVMLVRGHGTIFYVAFWLVYITGMAVLQNKESCRDESSIHSA